MTDTPNNETRRRILDVAEELFSKRGYAAVRLREIADAVGLRHASLYYYAPGGKEQLFVEVMERNLHRHRDGLAQAIAAAGDEFRAQMRAIAGWLVSQPPLDVARMSQADMPEIDPRQAHRLMLLTYESLSTPIMAALERARAGGQVALPDIELAAMALVSLVQSVHAIPEQYRSDPHQIGRQLVDMLLDGWLTR